MKNTLKKRVFGKTYEIRKIEEETPPAVPERDYEPIEFDYIPDQSLNQSISSIESKVKRRSLMKCLLGKVSIGWSHDFYHPLIRFNFNIINCFYTLTFCVIFAFLEVWDYSPG